MFLIEKASNALAAGIASTLNMDREREEVIAYGAFALMQTLWSIILVMLFGVVFNVVLESLVVSLAINALRKYSGGAHISSPNRCALVGAVVSTLLALAVISAIKFMDFFQIISIGLLCFAISYLIINRLAPVDSPGKPIKKIEKRKKLKKASFNTLHFLFLVAVVLSAVYYINDKNSALTYVFCICLGVIWQSFTLTRVGHLILGTIDNIIKRVSMF
jgi:accessory gene regulator B